MGQGPPPLISGGLGLQWLEAGSCFPSQRLKSGRGSEGTESWPLDHQGPVARDKALACQLHRNEFPQRRKVVKQVKCVLGGKRACVDKHTGRLRERVTPSRWFESRMWGISPGFPLDSHLALPGSESIFGLSRDPPTCACASLSQDGF